MGSEQLQVSFSLIIIVLFHFIKCYINNLFQGWHYNNLLGVFDDIRLIAACHFLFVDFIFLIF